MAATIIPLLVALLFSLDGADAFFNPIQHPSWASPHKQRPHADGAAIRNRTPPSPFTTPNRKSGWISPTIHTMSQDEIAETVDENVARLRETAAQVREQAAALEFQREVTRRKNADQSFKIFDANKDGFVDASDLQAGLEPPLRASYTKQLAVRMGRKPTREEVDHRIATELPGGKLFPDELAQKLVAAYDQNNDGVLQQSEFAPTEELRARLESMFRAQREEELEARIAERKLQAAERANEKGGAGNAGGAVIARNGINDGLPTAADKVLSALPYLLPLMDSLSYAGHLFTAYPDQMAWAQPLAGLLLAFRSIPFSTLVAFFGLSALAGMPQINKLVRYNIRQVRSSTGRDWQGGFAAWSLHRRRFTFMQLVSRRHCSRRAKGHGVGLEQT